MAANGQPRRVPKWAPVFRMEDLRANAIEKEVLKIHRLQLESDRQASELKKLEVLLDSLKPGAVRDIVQWAKDGTLPKKRRAPTQIIYDIKDKHKMNPQYELLLRLGKAYQAWFHAQK